MGWSSGGSRILKKGGGAVTEKLLHITFWGEFYIKKTRKFLPLNLEVCVQGGFIVCIIGAGQCSGKHIK